MKAWKTVVKANMIMMMIAKVNWDMLLIVAQALLNPRNLLMLVREGGVLDKGKWIIPLLFKWT